MGSGCPAMAEQFLGSDFELASYMSNFSPFSNRIPTFVTIIHFCLDTLASLDSDYQAHIVTVCISCLHLLSSPAILPSKVVEPGVVCC